jgi:SAM-dependent methyltransferase
MSDIRDPGTESLAHPLGDTNLQSEILESIVSAVNYHDWLTSLAVPYLGDNPIELGSGFGDYAQTWLDRGVPRITATEVDASRLAHLRARFADDPRVVVKSIDVLSPSPADHSSFVAFNVLEHIPNHVAALRATHTLLRPGGVVLIFVPAFGFAMSRFDRRVGHVRRYTVGGVREVLTAAGLDVERIRYVNLPGLPAWVLGMRLFRMTPSDGWTLRSWDRHVVPRARRWEARHRVPFGQSVFAVARVPSC